MFDQLITYILDESKWFTISLLSGLIGQVYLHYQSRKLEISRKQRLSSSLNFLFGVVVGTMAFGHLLAITVKLILGTLEGSIVVFYLIGIVLTLPSFFIIKHTWEIITHKIHERKTIYLNIWLVVTLLILGINNLPLAFQGILNIVYNSSDKKIIEWVVIILSISVFVGLFIGSVIFFISGQSFEQFKGI